MAMSESAQFTIGADANGTDGPCGTVIRVVVDPTTVSVTHLVVEPKHRTGLGRLVPLDLVGPIDPSSGAIQLRCSVAEFDGLASAEETQFLPGAGGPIGDYDAADVMAWPYYGLAGGLVPEMGGGVVPTPIVSETIPLGEVSVRRGESLHATDGHVGKVQGLVIDGTSRHVTHVLLQEGHLWGKKEVAIPIGAVSKVDDAGIWLTMTKDQVGDLPPVELDQSRS
jgi:sporulation protein YlmC with PRC-barrel domain